MEHEYPKDELTLKELILIVQKYFKEILRKWWMVGIITSITLAFFLYKHYTHVPTYPYELKFMVEKNEGSGGVGGILGQFGLGRKANNPFKIVEVTSSTRLLESTLKDKTNESILANKLLEVYELPPKWSESNADFKGFSFEDDLRLISKNDQIAYKRLDGLIWQGQGNDGKALMTINYSMDYGVFSLTSNTLNPELSKKLVDKTFENLTDFFENEVLKNKVLALTALNNRLDSLKIARDQKNLELAYFDESSSNVYNKTYKSKRKILQQDLLILNTSYVEVIKNKQIAEFNLTNNKATFLALDKTLEPISSINSDIKKKLLMGVLLGFFLSVILIVISGIYKNVMKS